MDAAGGMGCLYHAEDWPCLLEGREFREMQGFLGWVRVSPTVTHRGGAARKMHVMLCRLNKSFHCHNP